MSSRHGWPLLAAIVIFLITSFVQGDPPEKSPLKSPEAEKPARTDLYGDPLPLGAVSRIGTTRLRHGGRVLAAVFSADGKSLLSFGHDETFRVWEVGTGKELRSYPRQGEALRWIDTATFSTDGKLLALGCGGNWPDGTGTVVLIDAATGKLLRLSVLPKAGEGVRALTFSPDSENLSAGVARGGIHVIEVKSGKVRRVGEVEAMVTALAFSPDGQALASGDGIDGVHLWDVTNGKCTRILQTRGKGFVGKNRFDSCLAFAPDGKTLATSNSDDAVRLWEVETGKEVCKLGLVGRERRNSWRAANTLLFTPNGRALLADHDDGKIYLWDLHERKSRQTIRGHRERNSLGSGPALAISPDGLTLASWGWENTLRLWDVTSGVERLPFRCHRDSVTAVAFTPGGDSLATAGADGRVGVWQVAGSKALWTACGSGEGARTVAVSPDAKTLAAADRWDHVLLWDLQTGEELQAVIHSSRNWPERITAVAFSPADGSLISTGATTRRWDLIAMKELAKCDHGQADCSAVSADGWIVATVEEHLVDRKELGFNRFTARRVSTIHLWDLKSGKEMPRFSGAVPRALWVYSTSKRELQISGEKPVMSAVAFSPDARTLATLAEDNTVSIWEVATGQERVRFAGGGAVCFSPDGKVLVSGGKDGGVRLWEVATGKEVRRFNGHKGHVMSLAFSRDGTRLASGSTDCTALVWDVSRLDLSQRQAGEDLSARELDSLWDDLKADDAARAFRAIHRLTAHPKQAKALLSECVRQVRLDPKQLRQWLTDLDGRRFEDRARAMIELEFLGRVAEPALRKLLKERPTLEARRRAEAVLQHLDDPVPPAEIVRHVRAVEVLELIGDPEAKRVLEALAKGEPAARLTQEAHTTLKRLAGPRVSKR